MSERPLLETRHVQKRFGKGSWTEKEGAGMFGRFRTITGVIVAGSLFAFSASFGPNAPTAHAKTYTIFLIAGISSDAFYITMHKGASTEASKLGVTLKFNGAPSAFSPQTQIPILNAAIATHPNLILIAPTDKTALINPIRSAIKAGIPVITVDTFITANIAVTNISSDNVA